MNAVDTLAWLTNLAANATVVLVPVLAACAILDKQSAARRHALAVAVMGVILALGTAAAILPGYEPWIRSADIARVFDRWVGEIDAGSFAFYTAEAMGKSRSFAIEDAPRDGGLPLSAPSVAAAILFVWLLGASWGMARIVAGLAGALALTHLQTRAADDRLHRIAGECSRQMGLARSPRILISGRFEVPLVWGPPRASILLPDSALSWNAERLRTTLLHEMAHVRRRDSMTQALARCLAALLWFHPLAWLLLAKLQSDQEQACDDEVVRVHGRAATYARHLLSLATHPVGRAATSWSAFAGFGGRKAVTARIQRILAADTRREPLSRRFVAGVSAAAASLAAVLVFSPSGPRAMTAAVLNADTARGMVDLFERSMKDLEIPGAVIVLVKDGQVLLAHGAGVAEIETGRAADPERTVFRLGSITKVITAIALLQVLEQKGIDVDRPVAPFVPEFDVPTASGTPVTFRHLLTHTGGFDQLGYGRHAGTPERLVPLGTFLRDNLVPQRPPGEFTTYDTYGMTLAGHLVEKLSGTTYEAYIVEHVFRRLGMTHSGFQIPGVSGDELAVGYGKEGDHWETMQWEFHYTVPASSANATATDMGRLMGALLDGGRANGKALFSRATCDAMLRQQFSNHPRLPGFGFGVMTSERNGYRVAQHAGSMDGFSSLMLLLPDANVGLFVACNRENGRFTEKMAGELMQRFFPAVSPLALDPPWDGLVDSSRFTGNWINTLRCHTCEGRTDNYWRADPFELRATENGEIVLGGGPARAIGPLLFQRDDGLLIAFREDRSGHVTHLFVQQTAFERP